MEDKGTLKRDYSEGVEIYCNPENLRLVEEQRREERERIGFIGCKLNYEYIWS